MNSTKTIMKMHRRDLWFLVMIIVFVANTFVMVFYHHIVTEHHGTILANGDNDGVTVVKNMLSSFVEGGSKSNTMNHRKDDDLPVFSICLLTRDDLPILPEWIAYHYHSVNLRHLVVAVDPVSKTDPKPIFDEFRKYLGTDKKGKDGLIIEQWSEEDFMPQYFVDGDYGKAPNFVGGEGNPDAETWEEWYTRKKNFGKRKKRDQTMVNNHRYRQTRFLARCSEHLRDTYSGGSTNNNNTTPVFMSTLDSDEFMAVNPWIMSERLAVPKAVLRLEPGSVLRWLVDSNKRQTDNYEATTDDDGSDICTQVPRLLFGAVELSSDTSTPEKIASDVAHGFVRTSEKRTKRTKGAKNNSKINKGELASLKVLPRRSNKMETLRWKFHAAPNDERNFQQKVILDLHKIPGDDEIWGDHVHTVHRPSRTLCAPESDTNLDGTLLVPGSSGGSDMNNTTASPVVAFHYIGSEERYFSRPDDFRRNPKKYRERSNITHARDETGWIDQWLERFVEDAGIETSSALLSSYIVKEK